MANSNILIGGYTASANAMATPGAYKTIKPSSGNAAYFSIFNISGLQREYGTYFGGNLNTYLSSVCSSPDGSIFLGGTTTSTANLATPGSFISTFAGGVADGFFAKFDADNTITIAPLLNLSLCQGSVFNVAFTATGTYNTGNNFTILSTATHSQ